MQLNKRAPERRRASSPPITLKARSKRSAVHRDYLRRPCYCNRMRDLTAEELEPLRSVTRTGDMIEFKDAGGTPDGIRLEGSEFDLQRSPATLMP